MEELGDIQPEKGILQQNVKIFSFFRLKFDILLKYLCEYSTDID